MAGLQDWVESGPDASPAYSQPSPKPGTLEDWATSEPRNDLDASTKLAAAIPPQTAADVLKARDQTGLPTTLISRNLDQVKAKQNADIPQANDLKEQAPTVAGWMAEDPHHVAVARDDVSALSYLERRFSYMGNQLERGWFDMERSALGAKAFFGLNTPEDEKRIEALDARLKGDLNKPAPGPISNIFGKAVEQVPLIAGVTAGGAAAAAAEIPATAAAALAFGGMELGNAFLDFRTKKDPDGMPLSNHEAAGWSTIHSILSAATAAIPGLGLAEQVPGDDLPARAGAAASGAANAALSMVPMGSLMEKVPGLRMLSKPGIEALIKTPSARTAMVDLVKGIGESSLTMGGFSGMSTLVHHAAETLVGMEKDKSLYSASPAEILSRIFTKDAFKQAGQSTVSGMGTGAIFGAGFGGAGLYSDYRNAMRTQQSWKDIGEVVKSTKMSQIAPEQLERLVSRIAPNQNVYIPMEKWQAYWEGKKVDPRTAFQQATGNTASYDEAMRTGADVQMPASKYAVSIAPSEHNDYFSGVLRSHPMAYNAEDASQTTEIQKQVEGERQELRQPSLMRKGMDLVKGLFGRAESPKSPDAPPQASEEPRSSDQSPASGPEEFRSSAFPTLPDSYHQSISQHPDFVKLSRDADMVSRKYAAERGVESTPEFAKNLWREMHDALGELMRAPADQRIAVRDRLKQQYPDIEREFTTLNSKVFSDVTEGYFQKGIAGKYGALRPKVALEAEAAQKVAMKEGTPEKLETEAMFTKDPAAKAVIEAQHEQGSAPLFDDPKAVGMSEEKAKRYQDAIYTARRAAHDDLTNRLMSDIEKRRNRERDAIREQFEGQLNQDKRYIAASLLKSGKVPGGERLEGAWDAKLSKDAITADFPDTDLSKLRGYYRQEGGLHPDQAAEMFGFNSGSELLASLQHADKSAELDRMVEEELNRRHPDTMDPATLHDLASQAVHNGDRAKRLRLELEHLASNDFAAFKGLVRAVSRDVPRVEDVRADAEKMIASKLTADTNPYLYQRAESTAGREARENFLKGDFEKAFEAKKQELLNHEMYRAASDAREQAQKDLSFASKFDRDTIRAKLGKAGADYLEQIDALRQKFDFERMSDKDVQARQSLRDFVDTQRKAGYEPAIPTELLNDAYKKSWREMTNDDLHSVVDAMRNLDHLAGLKNKLLASQKERDYDEVKNSVIGSIRDTFSVTPEQLNKPFDLHPSWKDKVGTWVSDFGAWQTKMEYLFRFLDGGKYHGPAWETFFKPLNDAEDFKTSKLRDASSQVNDIFSAYSKSERADLNRKLFYIPELEGSRIKANLTKMEMLMTVLHWGNEGNRAELARGYGWNEGQVRAIWKNLDARDFAVADKIWTMIDSYWPEVSKQERDLNGLAPEKIQASPFEVQTADGKSVQLRGGYFPLVYDRAMSPMMANLGELENLKDLFPTQAGRAATRHGWTNERVGGGGQAPSLNISTFVNHVSDVIHDLAYRKPVIDAYKLINDDNIRPMIQASAGKELYDQLNPWLKRIAGDRPWNPLGPMGSLLTKLRTNATMAELAFKFTSAAVHTTSYLPATREMGVGYAVGAMKDFYSDMKGSWDFITERSEFMRSRPENMDRDLRARINSGKNLFDSPGMEAAAWGMMRAFDVGIAGPTWLGAYRKAMDGGVKNIEAGDERGSVDYADQLVRETKGSGAAKDLAPIETWGGPLGKLFTMFYRQQNVIANQFIEAQREYRIDKDIPKLMTTYAMSVILPAAMSELIRGRTPGDDESPAKWLGKSSAFFAMGAVPGLRDIVSGWNRGGIQPSPVFEALNTLLSVAKSTTKEQEWSRRDYENALMSVGYMTGLPTRQALKTAGYFHDWMTGEEQPDNPMEGMWRLAVGRKGKS